MTNIEVKIFRKRITMEIVGYWILKFLNVELGGHPSHPTGQEGPQLGVSVQV